MKSFQDASFVEPRECKWVLNMNINEYPVFDSVFKWDRNNVFCNVSYCRVTFYSFMWQLKDRVNTCSRSKPFQNIKARSESIN